MKRNVNCFISLFLLLSVLVNLCACTSIGMKKQKSVDEIREDMEKHEYLYSDPSVEIQNVEIIRRQTDKDKKTELVFVAVDSKTDYAERTDSWVIEYGYYDDIGWDYNNHNAYNDGTFSLQVTHGPNQSTVDEWFRSFNQGTTELPYDEWKISSTDLNGTIATVYCEAKSSYKLAGLNTSVVNEENVTIDFYLNEEGTAWTGSLQGGSYSSSIENISFASAVSASLQGTHNTWFATPTDSSYVLDIRSMNIARKNGTFSFDMDAQCDAHEYIYFGNGTSSHWSCHDFETSEVFVERDSISVKGYCTDDHIDRSYNLLFGTSDIDDWYDSGYKETKSTNEETFTIDLSPEGVEISFAELHF